MTMKKILVVDDEPDLRDMLRFALETEGFEVLEAADIQKAYWLITDQDPDLVLLDWMLPGGSGIELLSRLKKEEAPADQDFPMTPAGMKALAAQSLKNDAEFLNWIDQPEEMLTFVRYGKTVSFQNTTIVAQIVNHSIEHRAQIADILAINNMNVINLDALDPISYERAHR